ncbi:carboxylesterase/lipase family protein [Antrihabitans cavernicola]|uniref:Carboxylic ester hydrolase n=1 Tax=Antrihabitans cavernicola TaxID=2495913 RepID=A0A5A7S8H6_9NOCA|nr:carboxylesterase/lipase family protein [Spelaeibacter cavernicola]KAA0022440.1 carboxylesterase/lipase family protein [Spelaeibacter cavernicola]
MSELDQDIRAIDDAVAEAATPIVSTKYGDVAGRRDGTTRVWKAIPFAAEPTGPLRFRAPVPPEPWNGVRECTEFGKIAPQGVAVSVPVDPGLKAGEDCLWLNVWSPAEEAAPRPVLVWIHGGAYCLGSSAQRIYDGKMLAELGDCVIVTFNYRLGALGFLDLSSFSTDEHVFESNLGLRDQIAALEWVRDNIAAFGGDPGNVTLFGESSGGGSVTTLMTSPHAEGLFHQAIAQSPPATSVYGPERAAGVARRFLEVLDLSPERAGDLYDLPIMEIIEASDALVDEIPEKVPGTLAMAPVVDGDIVPRYPVAAFQKGLSHRIPLIIGTNHDEASLFRLIKSSLMPVTPDAVNAMLSGIAVDHPDLSPERLAEIISAYPDASKAKGAQALSQDAAFRMPSIWIAEAHSRHSATWLYRFDHATPMLKAARVGAGHATELPYVFGNFGAFDHDPTFWLGGRKSAMEVSGRIQRRWLAFAAHGVPAAIDGSKHWPSYNEESRATLLIDSTDAVIDDPDKDLRSAWGDEVMAFS